MTTKVDRFDIYGWGDLSDNGSLYNVDDVHKALQTAIANNNNREGLVSDLCLLFGVEVLNGEL